MIPQNPRQLPLMPNQILQAAAVSARNRDPVRILDLRKKLSVFVQSGNVQVNALKDRLPGFRVGTVDKFQGQEAPVVIYSMTSSSPEDAPRGMGFLFDPHRLNVATSRAQCLTILIAKAKGQSKIFTGTPN